MPEAAAVHRGCCPRCDPVRRRRQGVPRAARTAGRAAAAGTATTVWRRPGRSNLAMADRTPVPHTRSMIQGEQPRRGLQGRAPARRHRRRSRSSSRPTRERRMDGAKPHQHARLSAEEGERAWRSADVDRLYDGRNTAAPDRPPQRHPVRQRTAAAVEHDGAWRICDDPREHVAVSCACRRSRRRTGTVLPNDLDARRPGEGARRLRSEPKRNDRRMGMSRIGMTAGSQQPCVEAGGERRVSAPTGGRRPARRRHPCCRRSRAPGRPRGRSPPG